MVAARPTRSISSSSRILSSINRYHLFFILLFTLLLLFIVVFATQQKIFFRSYASGNSSISEVQITLGIQITPPPNVAVNKIENGVYEIKSPAFPCNPGPNCEPDRYEIRYPKVIAHIFII